MLELVNTLGRADSMKLHMRWYVEKFESYNSDNGKIQVVQTAQLKHVSGFTLQNLRLSQQYC
jgi:hypothetical protein